MAKLSLSSLGPMLKEKRQGKGIREIAKEIGISPATLSRVENGKEPDLGTFRKICQWLKVDPNEVLGYKTMTVDDTTTRDSALYAHLRADRNLDRETTRALAEMILRARKMIAERIR